VKKILEFGYPPAVIREVARRRRPDLVAVGATGTSDLRHILLGSVAQHVLRKLRSDVLLVRAGTPLFELP
jgi:nucleotide-binding universal stress UspA family protein